MIKDATKQIIKRTLQSSFDKEQFLNFTKNLLNHINEDKAFHAHGYVKEQFKKTANIIKTYERLGTYTDPNEKKIDILVVYLEKDNSIDRARTSLRNFVADYLKGRDQKDAALVAFVSPSQDDWRFSLIKMEYKFEEGKSGKMKVKEEFTPARRWSFLVGSKESSHTAQSRLAPILEDDDSNPTLEQLEDAFNIEKVTKEFFEKYRELFLRLKDNLDEMVKNDTKIKADFAEKDVDTVDFAKKLLGQIVFLYFLQKKGWFGVERDADWGTGPKDFLRQLYSEKHSKYKNFFNEILEPMFYEALARERDDDYYGSFNCKIPFLNGGLFDPIGNYDWVHTDINLDNELFSNSRPTKQGDIGDGILDIFDRYNFTVREDEPLEKEVAVDPEMLGKVFENLLEVKDRKSKGTYYTPREIVHYMCEQSLINYLATELPEVTKNDLEEFIKIGDQVLENEYLVTQKDSGEGSMIPASIKENAKLIDQKLADIKVCDPAIGSGAFPVGMMGEIVTARLSLNPFLCHSGLDPESSSLECAGRTAYDFKMQAITNSIYGVDIDPGAVEIAKLRLWLSLVVDENDIKQIKPLPNLDYKIMQGNSLLEEFEGIKLFDESIIPQDHADREAQIVKANEKINELQREFFRLHSKNALSKSQEQLIKQQIKGQQKLIQSLQEKPKQGGTVDLFNKIDEIKARWDELTELHKKIVNESNRQEKTQMLDRASELEWQFIEATLKRECKPESLKKIEQFKKKNTKPFFLWHLHFADVFQSKSGFNVVIANPPYVSAWSMEKEDPNMRPEIKSALKNYSILVGHWDLYIAFVAKGHDILSNNGSMSYIVPNPILREKYAKETREFLLTQMRIASLLEFNDTNVFDGVARRTTVLVAKKGEDKSNYKIDIHSNKDSDIIGLVKNIERDNWLSHPSHSFLIDSSDEKDDLIVKIEKQSERIGNFFYVNYGAQVSSKDKGGFGKKDVVSKHPVGNAKPYYEGKDIQRWKLASRNLWLDYRPKEMYGPRHPSLFEQEKIAIRMISDKGHALAAVLDETGRYSNHSVVLIAPYHGLRDTDLRSDFDDFKHIDADIDIHYVLAIILSKLESFYFKKRFATESLQGSTSHTYPTAVRGLVIKNISKAEQNSFVTIADQILTLKKQNKDTDTKNLESQIDQMVYKLYGLTPEEIKIVEGSNG